MRRAEGTGWARGQGRSQQDRAESRGGNENARDTGALSAWQDGGFGCSASRVWEQGDQARQLPGPQGDTFAAFFPWQDPGVHPSLTAEERGRFLKIPQS